MPGNAASELYEVVWLIRRLFRALSQKSSEMLEGRGITVADRAVMEFLYPDRRLSVPEIASRYQVSRQHVQVTVNVLLQGGMVVTEENPRHKRSPLIALSRNGRELFADILRQDEKTLEGLFSGVSTRDLHTTRRTLEALLQALS
jgi:DNA-binding MarR family transcriptional regulator